MCMVFRDTHDRILALIPGLFLVSLLQVGSYSLCILNMGVFFWECKDFVLIGWSYSFLLVRSLVSFVFGGRCVVAELSFE